MQRAIATIGTGPLEQVLDTALPTFRDYASRHGYDLVLGDGDARGRPTSWGKVPLLRRLLDGYDAVLWIDADAVVLDPTDDVAEHVPAGAWQAMARHTHTGDPNVGVWLLRGDRAKRFLDAVWAAEEFVDHPWWENAAAMHLLGFDLDGHPGRTDSEWVSGTHWLPDRWNRQVDVTGELPSIRHYSGKSTTYRRVRMRIDLAHARGRWLAPLLEGAWQLARRVKTAASALHLDRGLGDDRR